MRVQFDRDDKPRHDGAEGDESGEEDEQHGEPPLRGRLEQEDGGDRRHDDGGLDQEVRNAEAQYDPVAHAAVRGADRRRCRPDVEVGPALERRQDDESDHPETDHRDAAVYGRPQSRRPSRHAEDAAIEEQGADAAEAQRCGGQDVERDDESGFDVKGKKMRHHRPTRRVSELPKLNAEQRAGDHSYKGYEARDDDPVVNAEFHALDPSGVQTEAADDGRDGDETAAESTQASG